VALLHSVPDPRALLSYRQVVMSALCRVPLRAFPSPAAVIGKPPSISATSFHSFAKSSLRQSPLSREIATRSWGRRVEPKAFAGGRRYSSTPQGGLDAEKNPGNKTRSSGSSQGQRKAIRYFVVLGVLGIGAVVFSDQYMHAYRAAARSGRVVGTLAVCINE
jgi:aarF domain-containing kinase